MALLIPSLLHRLSYATKRHYCVLSAIIGTAVFLLSTPVSAQPSAQYRIKAAFLFNFAQFVEWPADAFSNSNAPIIIGILGNDPFGAFLDDLVRGEKVNNRPLIVRRYRNVREIEPCHILFISDSEMHRLDDILQQLSGRPILTVGDSEGFARRGGVLRFLTENNKIRFRINTEAAQRARLSISSKLLRASELITTEKEQ